MNADRYPVQGAGLGLRRALLGPLQHQLGQQGPFPVDFMEIAPENWMGVGGRLGKRLKAFTKRVPFVCHGLSLSLGGGGYSRILHDAVRYAHDKGCVVVSSKRS